MIKKKWFSRSSEVIRPQNWGYLVQSSKFLKPGQTIYQNEALGLVNKKKWLSRSSEVTGLRTRVVEGRGRHRDGMEIPADSSSRDENLKFYPGMGPGSRPNPGNFLSSKLPHYLL